MKKIFLAGLLSLAGSGVMVAEDVVLETNHESGAEILQDGVFNRVTMNLGNCSENTQVYLGEVDFGTTGDNFKAAGIIFANGWYTDGWAILHAGADYESSLPFTAITIDETGGYEAYYTFADSLAYLKEVPFDIPLPGQNPDEVDPEAPVQSFSFVKPTGKQKVYLTFIGGSGNIRAVNLYEEFIPQEKFIQEGEHDYLYGLALRTPNMVPGYENISQRLLCTESVPMVPTGDEAGEGQPFYSTKLDGSTDENGNITNPYSWGWTDDGFLVDYGTMDFGNGEYDQFIAYVKRDNNLNINIYLEVYLDEVTEENKLATIWTGLQLRNITPLAINIKQVTGQHKVIAKWIGGGFNLQDLEISKGAQWDEAMKCGITVVNETASENALHTSFVGTAEGQLNVFQPGATEPSDMWGYEVKAKGQYESAGNIGYTKNGTVLGFYHPTSDDGLIDFGNGEFKRIIINHSSESNWLGELEEANFSFYLDLDPDMVITPEEWDTNLAGILEGHEPVAQVRIQGTGSWGIKKHTAGKITTPIVGSHELFMVYTITTSDSAGANVFDIYFDTEGGIDAIESVVTEGVEAYAAEGQVIVNTVNPAQVDIYSLSGVNMGAYAAAEGENIYNVAPGFYIVKVTAENGAVASFKVLVK